MTILLAMLAGAFFSGGFVLKEPFHAMSLTIAVILVIALRNL